ncbi:MAG: NAD(P)/FAD-dependent oxidoreductase, partial [Pseudomonadota bacterium]
LIGRGISPVILDAADRPAASWRARHPQLHLNTHRRLSHMPGRRFDAEAGAFPARDAVIRYIEDYEADLGIRVRRGVRAEKVQREAGGWAVETSAGPMAARHLIIATGPDRVPVVPDWPGADTFEGELIHARDFGRVEDCDGKRVLLVGAGNSSVDIANHLSCRQPEQVWMSVRGGATVAPVYVLGVPTHLLTPALRHLPAGLMDRGLALLSRLVCGDLTRFGLPGPVQGALARIHEDGSPPALDNGFAQAVRAGDIEIVPEIAAFDGPRVRLQNDSVISPDLVICGTGYRPGLEPLVGHLDVLDDRGEPQFSGLETSPGHDGLWFFGFRNSLWGNLNERRREASRLATTIGQGTGT